MGVRDRRRHSSSPALDSGAARLSCVPRRAPIVLLHRWSMEQGLDPLGLPMDVPWSGHCVSAQSQRPRKCCKSDKRIRGNPEQDIRYPVVEGMTIPGSARSVVITLCVTYQRSN